MWEGKLYHSLNYELRREFGRKVIKLSIDGGFTCPNRDGKKGLGGCTFCGSRGSGEYTDGQLFIKEQMTKQIELLSPKWKDALYIAYFQNFSNTYANIEELQKKYDEALSFDKVVGLAIATRPDCIDSNIVQFLNGYNKKTYLWVEMGIQTTNEKTIERINRKYNNQEMELAFDLLNAQNISTVAHIILNLPGEVQKDYYNTIEKLIKYKVKGIKLHMLNILKGTALGEQYMKSPFPLMNVEEYIQQICNILEVLPKDIVIHRLTGDGSKEELIAPHWICNKRAILNGIDKELKKRHSFQGIYSLNRVK